MNNIYKAKHSEKSRHIYLTNGKIYTNIYHFHTHGFVDVYAWINGVGDEYVRGAVLLPGHTVMAVVEGVYEEWRSGLTQEHEVKRGVLCGSVAAGVEAVDGRLQHPLI